VAVVPTAKIFMPLIIINVVGANCVRPQIRTPAKRRTTMQKHENPRKSLEEILYERGWDGTTPELTEEDRLWLNMPAVGDEIEW